MVSKIYSWATVMSEYDRFWEDILIMDYASLRNIGSRIANYIGADPDQYPDVTDGLIVSEMLFQIAENEKAEREED